jgi:hypothetical protein
MQQSCTYGSVRGAAGDRRPYRDESLASHRDGRGAPMARRDDREYRGMSAWEIHPCPASTCARRERPARPNGPPTIRCGGRSTSGDCLEPRAAATSSTDRRARRLQLELDISMRAHDHIGPDG